MTEKEITWDNLENRLIGEDDIFKKNIFKKEKLIQEIELEDLEESE